jgi:hypothetical protein
MRFDEGAQPLIADHQDIEQTQGAQSRKRINNVALGDCTSFGRGGWIFQYPGIGEEGADGTFAHSDTAELTLVYVIGKNLRWTIGKRGCSCK